MGGKPPDVYGDDMNTIGSHDCGTGRNKRTVWGSREDCDRCKQADAQFKAAQEFYRKRDLIADVDPVNVLLQKEERVAV